jgi:hypothetical protein
VGRGVVFWSFLFEALRYKCFEDEIHLWKKGGERGTGYFYITIVILFPIKSNDIGEEYATYSKR